MLHLMLKASNEREKKMLNYTCLFNYMIGYFNTRHPNHNVPTANFSRDNHK